MIIHDTHQKINALKELIPGGFVFVLDTTDRSFVFKSGPDIQCEQRVISLDRVHGIDTLTKFTDFYSFEDDTSYVKLRRISENTFIGLCGDKEEFSAEQWSGADDYLQRAALTH
ncbi:MAG: hypothetical protein RLN88_00875 [Ekhidna sp.]|uniref:hypothetical protein n=1 Tax=Ekhidna sp. TaxID=2608089 RepID=UPI0032EB356E